LRCVEDIIDEVKVDDRRSLVSWSSKKQNSVALSTAEAEYIATGSCCAQILWIKTTLNDSRIKFKQVPLHVTIKVS
jgi:hypothetical protein